MLWEELFALDIAGLMLWEETVPLVMVREVNTHRLYLTHSTYIHIT